MMIGLIIRGARSASGGGPRQPVKRKRKTYTPGHARLVLACGLAWVIFITYVMIKYPMSP